MKKNIIWVVVLVLAGISDAYCAWEDIPEDWAIIVDEPQSRGTSTSSSSSTSSINGKTTTKTTTSTTNSGVKGVRSVKDLAIYPLFEKYKRHPNTKLTEIESSSLYRCLSIKNDSKLMAEITKAFEIDAKKASSIMREYDERRDNAILGILVGNGSCSIGYKINADGASGEIFLSCPVSD